MYVYFRPEDLWSIYFQFPGKKYALVKMSEREITYGSLVNVMVSNGYCKDDSLCYLKEEDIGLQGVCVIKGNIEVVRMPREFESTQTLSLTVVKGKLVIEPPIGEDQDAQQIDAEPDVVFVVAESGVVHKSVPPNCQLHLGTQESVNFLPLKSVPPNCQLHLGTQLNTEVSVNYADFQFDSDEEDNAVSEEEIPVGMDTDEEDNAVSEEGSSSDEDFVVDVDHLDAGEEEDDSDSVQYVEEQIANRRKEEPELDETISEIKRKRAEYMASTHCEGDTDPEDIYDMDQEEDDEEAQEIPVPEPMKKKAKRPGPTSRSHSSAGPTINHDWFPSSEEEDTCFEGDDDGNEPMSFVISSGRRSRAKKRPPRVWYDEDRMHLEQQFQLKLCFKDVYQFREALVNLHVKQLRRYKYHRNCSDRVIVCCDGEGCQFHIVAAKISNEPTFCIKKMILEHTCPTQSEKTRISSKWLGNKMLETIRSDPNTTVPAIVDKVKRQFGVEVPKMMAWRAKRKAKEIVLGDHKRQYKRLRDFLETVKATNPGSRCIVSTVSGKTRENPTAGPRFHGLFFCLNACVEGFLNGCRPFIGLDGCFIKLTSGAQILAATGRDANNNMYPIAFGVVGVEDTRNWSWFLTQLSMP